MITAEEASASEEGTTPDAGQRLLSLEHVRADGWHERLASGSPAFAHLCEVVGEHFVAFSIVAGVRIAALSVDRHVPDASLVEFTVGTDTQMHRLPLGDFRLRITESLLSNEESETALPEQPTADDIQAFLGLRTVLLAAVFDISPRLLELPKAGEPHVHVRQIESQADEAMQVGTAHDVRISLSEFRSRVRQGISHELELLQSKSRLAIDLEVLPEAQEAMNRGRADQVIEALQTWPALLGIMMRTQDLQALPKQVTEALAQGIALLSAAYVHSGQVDLAESVLRFGVQWAQGTSAAGLFYLQLGDFLSRHQRPGEAIGMLRRVQAVGDHAAAKALPSLARCYVERGKYVAAALCVLQAIELGAERRDFADIEPRIAAALSSGWPVMQALPVIQSLPAMPPARA